MYQHTGGSRHRPKMNLIGKERSPCFLDQQPNRYAIREGANSSEISASLYVYATMLTLVRPSIMITES